MAADDDRDPDGLDGPGPLPPEDRLWRHPSELAAGMAPPAAWSTPRATDPHRRLMMVGALVSASLAGAVVAVGAMWVARPTRVVTRSATASTAVATATVAFAPGFLPTEQLAQRLAPSLPGVRAARSGTWTDGTGVWLDDDGFLAAPTTLVLGADEVVVTGPDGIARPALVVGSDPATGVSTLRVARTTGTPLPRSLALPRVGERVALLGAGPTAAAAPTAATVATATISAPAARATIGTLVLHDAIALDRGVPHGAVGGVVLDADGRVVGLTVGLDDEGTTVASPAAEALAAADDLRDDGKVQRAWLGVRAVDLDPALASRLEVRGGAALTQVDPGSPADQAGLQAGDVITAIDGQSVDNASDLVVSLRHHRPGDWARIGWQRGDQRQQARVHLGG
jgi:S1-C subfamily serine protease